MRSEERGEEREDGKHCELQGSLRGCKSMDQEESNTSSFILVSLCNPFFFFPFFILHFSPSISLFPSFHVTDTPDPCQASFMQTTEQNTQHFHLKDEDENEKGQIKKSRKWKSGKKKAKKRSERGNWKDGKRGRMHSNEKRTRKSTFFSFAYLINFGQ